MDNQKLLIVEDEDLNIKLYQLLLKPLNLNIFVAKNGDDAINIINKEKPSLIICDIEIIGNMSGMEIAKYLHNNQISNPEFEKIKIIAVTAYAMPQDVEKILKAGFDKYVAKPIDTRSFFDLIKSYYV